MIKRTAKFVCAKRNIIGRSPHHCEAHHLPQATSFICVRLRRNDVDFGQMMLRASTQMMLCPADTNEKIHRNRDGFFGGATRISHPRGRLALAAYERARRALRAGVRTGFCRLRRQSPFRRGSSASKTKAPLLGCFVLRCVDKKDAFTFYI